MLGIIWRPSTLRGRRLVGSPVRFVVWVSAEGCAQTIGCLRVRMHDCNTLSTYAALKRTLEKISMAHHITSLPLQRWIETHETTTTSSHHVGPVTQLRRIFMVGIRTNMLHGITSLYKSGLRQWMYKIKDA